MRVPALAALLALLAAPALAGQAPAPAPVCVLDPGETACVLVCAPGAMLVTAEGAGASVRATCGASTLACATGAADPCFGARASTAAGFGLCESNGLGRATCASA